MGLSGLVGSVKMMPLGLTAMARSRPRNSSQANLRSVAPLTTMREKMTLTPDQRQQQHLHHDRDDMARRLETSLR